MSLSASGQTFLYIQALADSGSATLTFSSPGYISRQATVNFYPSGFVFNQTVQNTTKTNPFQFGVSLVPILPSSVVTYTQQSLRGGLAPVAAALVSSQPAVGTLKPATLTFNAGDNFANATFTPAAIGNTIVTITPPAGFGIPAVPSQLVITVN